MTSPDLCPNPPAPRLTHQRCQGQAIALPWRLDHLPPDAPPPDEDAPPGHDRPQDDGPIHPAPDEIRLIPGQRALAA